jgi:hypothetical protein
MNGAAAAFGMGRGCRQLAPLALAAGGIFGGIFKILNAHGLTQNAIDSY